LVALAGLAACLPGAATAVGPTGQASPQATAVEVAHSGPVQVAQLLDEAAPIPTTEQLAALAQAALTEDKVGPAVGVSVRDVLTGAELFNNGTGAHTPASTMKILTAASAIDHLGPSAALATTVVSVKTGQGQAAVTLVAGGDVLLAPDAGNPLAVNGRAGLGDLARAAAVALRGQGVTEVTVALDDTLFTGPNLWPDWAWSPTTEWGSPIYPIAIYSGRAGENFDEHTYLADPAIAAAQQFALKLAEAGADTSLNLPQLTVTGEVARAAAPAAAREIARVQSAPLRELVSWQLQMSDNVLSEALGRVAAVAAGQEGSFAGCAAAISQTVESLGLDATGLNLVDCSGLSHDSVVPAGLLTAMLTVAAGDQWATIQRGLPVAGLEGTMSARLVDYPAGGNVRAKTGSLTGVNGLAGVVQTTSGRQLAFAVLIDQSQAIWYETVRGALDEFAGGLAGL
jgi:D-alanyl-D-alanine carboxypeptidase/D-alanyl-D-alanine-endopeptidase (penicillin-binding protein 4)